MIETNETYQRIRALSGSHYEVNVVVHHPGEADTVYGMDDLKTCKITQGLFSKKPPTMGGTVASQCNLTLLEDKDNWPRGGAFDVRVRIFDEDETEYSDWVTLGQFYTDTRVQNGSTLEIYGLDAMVQFEQSWTDKVEDLPTEWPITAKAAVDLICEALDFELSEDTELDDEYKFVGLKTAVTAEGSADPVDDTFTARDTLASVAAAMGANWHITPDGKLRLIPFKPGGMIPGSAAIAGIAIAGITIVGTQLPSEASEDEPEYIYVGPDQFSHLETGVPLPEVEGIALTAPDGTEAVSGEEYRMQAVCDFSNSSAATLALTKLGGYVYKPFSVTRCYLDPCVEVGDLAYIGGTLYHIMSATWTLGKYMFCSFSAPYEAEQEHEYVVQSETTKAMLQTQKVEAKLQSTITQTASDIMLTVSQTYETKGEASGSYAALESKVDINADKIALVVRLDEEDPDNPYKIRAAEIVTAINEDGESAIKISASRVNLSGYVTISSLGAGGSTIVDGSRIRTGTLDANAIKAGTLSANMISGGVINAEIITVKNLNAANITSGLLGDARIPGLGASKITSGSFATDRIPSLNCDKITAGTFSADRIPNLNADKITAGTIDASKITVTNLNANNITTGTIDASKITVKNLNASNISTGTLSATRISGGTLDCNNITVSNLSASSITSGTLDADTVTIKNLKVTTLKVPSGASNSGKNYMFVSGTQMYIGGDNSSYNMDWINFHASRGLYIKVRTDYSGQWALVFDTTNHDLFPNAASAWSLGTEKKWFNYGYFNVIDTGGVKANIVYQASANNGLTIGQNGNKLGFWGKTPVAKQRVTGNNAEATLKSLCNVLYNYGLINT